MSNITYKPVDSSNIAALAYDGATGYVQFTNGRRFGYTMPKALFDQLMAAKSKGSFFAKSVKGKCAVAFTGWKCDNSPCERDAVYVGRPANNPAMPAFKVCRECAKNDRFHGINFSVIEERR